MAKADLSIRLEDGDRARLPGEVVRGTVEVAVNSDCTCNGLNLTFGWRTHGRGNKVTEDLHAETLTSGTWQTGERMTFPFEAMVPPGGPASYHGHHLNVDWYVRVTADIPWALDPSAEQDFLVERPADSDIMPMIGNGPGSSELLALYGRPASELSSAALSALKDPLERAPQDLVEALSRPGPRLPIFIGLGIFVVAAMFIGGIAITVAPFPIGCLVSLAPLAMLGFVAFMVLRNTFAKRKLGEVDFTVQPEQIAAPGDSLVVRLAFTPPQEVKLNAVELRLRGVERVVSGSGTNRTTHTHELCRMVERCHAAQTCPPGELVEAEAVLQLPADAPSTFLVRDNTIDWSIEAHVDIPLWPDWNATKKLFVLPTPVVAALRAGSGSAASAKVSSTPGSLTTTEPSRAASEPVTTVAEPSSSSDVTLLGAATERLASAHYGNDREKVFSDLRETRFALEIRVESTGATSGLDATETSRGGKTIRGHVEGLETAIALQLPADCNDAVDALGNGGVIQVSAQLVGWHSVHGLPILEAASL